MSWKSYVEKQNAKVFVLPDGWDSRETVAEDLGCSTERVDEQLRPGLKSGEIEKQTFRVWDKTAKKVAMVIAYRRKDAMAGGPASQTVQRPWTDEERAKARAMREAGRSNVAIGRELGRSEAAIRRAIG